MKVLDLQGFDARLLILTFGVGGTNYKRTQDSLEIAGFKTMKMKKLLKDIHLHSVACLHTIVIQRVALTQKLSGTKLPDHPSLLSCSCAACC